MDDPALAVDHDVAIVAVLDLDEVAQQRVGGHRLDEVDARLLEFDGLDAAVLEEEEAFEVVDLGAAHLVAGSRVGDDIDHSTLPLSARPSR